MSISPKLQMDQLQHLLCCEYVGDGSMVLNPGEQTEGRCLSFLLVFLIIQFLGILPFCKQRFKLQNINFYRR